LKQTATGHVGERSALITLEGCRMDWIFGLAIATFLLLLAFLWWNRASTKRHQETGGNVSGIGGLKDPMSGTTKGMRSGDEIRASLDAAASASTAERIRQPADHR
jgi:hypothetical protein